MQLVPWLQAEEGLPRPAQSLVRLSVRRRSVQEQEGNI